MKTLKIFLIALPFFLPSSVFMMAQGGGLDSEIGFQYVKAEYLFETSRFDECIQEYNQVIAKNPTYKDALVKRAMAKYNLAAFKGAKMDALQSIDLIGITSTAAFILGKTEYAMGNPESAVRSISAAIGLESKVDYLELRAEIYEKSQLLLKACEDYHEAARMGSMLGEQKSRNLCGAYKPKTTPPIIKPKSQQRENDSPSESNPYPSDSTSIESGNNTESQDSTRTDTGIPEKDPTIPEEDDFVQGVEIDEDLSIDIYGQGLGRRKVITTPSILIIADETGSVCLDISVNNMGEVTKAEFNANLSTIAKKSLVNLALRKAKEFSFEKSMYTNQNGFMVFKVKSN